MKKIRLTTESGDEYKIKVKDNITDDELEAKLREEFPDEWGCEGPGWRGSYIYIHVENEEDYQEL